MSDVAATENTKDMQYQAEKDLAKRSSTGAFIYLVIWFTIITPYKFWETAPVECFWISVFLIVLAIARTVMIKNFDLIYEKEPFLWKCCFYPLIITSALVWGILCAVTLINPIYQQISFVILVATAGLAGGGGSSLAPNKMLGILLISALIIPAGTTILFYSAEIDYVLGLIFFIYWFGMYSVVKTQHNEYWESLRNAFDAKQYSAKLEELNTMDGLTGLKNRVHFDKRFHIELKNASRYKLPISLLLIDIDHFKSINDQYGHLTGDNCLKVFAKLLSSISKRENDVVARYGGEEFAVILPGTTDEQSVNIAEKIRSEAEKTRLDYSEGTLGFTVSIGIANMAPDREFSENTVIEAADKALYEAKSNGRNQVVSKKLNFENSAVLEIRSS